MEQGRKIKSWELELTNSLLLKCGRQDDYKLHPSILVEEVTNEEIGTIRFLEVGRGNENRVFGQKLSETIVIDKDNVQILVSLIVDNSDNLFELEIWKTNFEPILKRKL